jgi:hypothetical protein
MRTKVFGFIVLFLLSAVVFGCSEDKEETKDVDNEKIVDDEKNKGNVEFKVRFSDPKAILLKKNNENRSAKSDSLRSSGIENETTLFQITENGDVLPVIEGVVVTNVKSFSYGAYVEIGYEEKYIIYLDNTYIKLPNDYSLNFVGENEEGDLIFSDVSMIKKGSTELKKMQTALSSPRIQSMSGNFAVIDGSGIFQIYNTAGGERYNIQGCNGPRIVALNKERALINDCQEDALIDMNTGIRSNVHNIYVSMWNGEHIYLKNGAIIMSQGLTEYGYGIGIVDINGNLEVVCNDGFNPGFSACMNCGNGNSVLFVSNNHYIVRELTQISVVKKGESTKKSILIGYNVISISVAGDKVFFIAEDNFGNKKTGFYSLTTEETILIITQEEFDEIFAF